MAAVFFTISRHEMPRFPSLPFEISVASDSSLLTANIFEFGSFVHSHCVFPLRTHTHTQPDSLEMMLPALCSRPLSDVPGSRVSW